ncbi:hypothetical protein [Kozakia baliensis]|uniref:Uncharacterized protein n=1 Tax=Kozakia baliensis TaxID=153496 RepID=A0A1D8UR43_9PROT|nr:hypothetical protein [Kozakia baliensis]AOX16104.1 hypothetical protein A0U89_01985 [Kozakia baliensis]GEL65420.1 hypothetical protein KBA01_27060 [Kozakia baliensis]
MIPNELPSHLVEIWNIESLRVLETIQPLPPHGFISVAGVARMMGWPWWRALMRHTDRPHILDCGAAAGLAACALREGQKWVVFDGPDIQAASLQALADICEARLLRTRPPAFALGMPPYDTYRRNQLAHYFNAEAPPDSPRPERTLSRTDGSSNDAAL